MSVRDEIFALFAQVAEEQQKRLAPLTDSLGLLETGLDSLCFAIIVARLEDSSVSIRSARRMRSGSR